STEKGVVSFPLPGKFIDGTLLTFFFEHRGADGREEPIVLNFMKDSQTSSFLQFSRNKTTRILLNETVNGKDESTRTFRRELPRIPPSNGWWRIDIYKMTTNKLLVFFQGWAFLTVEFKNTLDVFTRVSIYGRVNSFNLNEDEVYISHKQSKENIEVLKDFYYRYTPIRQLFTSIPHFQVGSHIDFTAVLPDLNDGKSKPSIEIRPRGNGNNKWALTITQMAFSDGWDIRGLSVYLHTTPKWEDGLIVGTFEECTKGKDVGMIVHLRLERIAFTKVELTLFYFDDSLAAVTCTLDFGNNYAEDYLNNELE
ncbi:hypothetical protein PFISCL1PPCAC_17805, partial [Pristionchus fissidentatus]